jgi:hypothetical protein
MRLVADTARCRTGALVLSPSIGNLHGIYLNPPSFRQDMCVVALTSQRARA